MSHTLLEDTSEENHETIADNENQIEDSGDGSPIKVSETSPEPLESVGELEPNADDMDNDDDEEDGTLEHPGLLCRLCAKPVENAHYIFDGGGTEDTLAKKINFSLPIKVCD